MKLFAQRVALLYTLQRLHPSDLRLLSIIENS